MHTVVAMVLGFASCLLVLGLALKYTDWEDGLLPEEEGGLPDHLDEEEESFLPPPEDDVGWELV